MASLPVVITTNAMRPEEIVGIIVEEHITAFARTIARRVVLNVVCFATTGFRCCRVELNLIDITPKRSKVEIIITSNSYQVRIDLTSQPSRSPCQNISAY